MQRLYRRRMRLVLKYPVDPDAELIGISVGGLTAALTYAWFHLMRWSLPKGLLCRVANIPCLFCGGNRSLTLFLGGDLLGALQVNPLIAVGLVFAVIWFAYALVVVSFRLPRIRVVGVTGRNAILLRFGVVIVLLANWVYVWWYGI